MPDRMMYIVSQWRAILICCCVCLGAFQFGYETSYFSGVLAMEAFLKVFGDYRASNDTWYMSSSTQSLITSIINVGELGGAITAYYVGDKLGRKGGLYVSSAAVILGTILQTTSTGIGELIAGRIAVGYAVGLISCFVPLYVADCSPARLRGPLVSLYQFSIGIGLVIGISVANSTKNQSSTASYRIPMALQALFPLLLLPALFLYAPESPRWLLEKKKSEEAQRSLRKIIGPKECEIQHEKATIEQSIRAQELGGKSSWKSIFSSSVERRKAYIGIILQGLQQGSGINFINSYGILFFFDIGISNSFLIQIGLYIIGMPGTLLMQVLVERVGRRILLIITGSIIASALIIMASCGLVEGNPAWADRLIVSMVYIYMFVFNVGWGPTVWVITSEISTGRNRGKLMSLSTASSWFFSWLITFTFPYLFNAEEGANLSSKVGYIYGGMMVASCVWVFFCLPETSGRSLEEINALFELKIPARRFKAYNLAPLTAETNTEKVLTTTKGT
ncbi:hypothetical protein BP6252_01201 [Coleophoma cylindrospora]|uniref:Major facilitator superfamily (MFS) profile domain-containing protein n=1 Tax=Coleophoma cylindrospora TaxID=1849047 RepID=A0A3D8SS73_9HELO|nr:hypothetical protein BP6252_01201 [Coleophoma cylindrospora]